MSWSSEALKATILSDRPLDDMSETELYSWRNSLNPDSMGFDGEEGADNEQ